MASWLAATLRGGEECLMFRFDTVMNGTSFFAKQP
jgi:hypothetical protein